MVLLWTGRHAAAIYRLNRGVGGTMFYDAAGHEWFPLDEQRRDVPFEQISTYFKDAVISIEDHRYYSHFGIDPIAVTRAAVFNLRSSEGTQGGSTITQQLARTLYLSNARTFARKAQEAALAVMLEIFLSKKEILELYFDRVYLSGGVYGVESMSEKLFGKPASKLTLGEAALIAGIIRAPAAYSPWTHFDAARRRSFVVLQRMREEKKITPEQEQMARAEQIRIEPLSSVSNARQGYAKEFLRQQFRDIYGGDNPPDWKVHTSFVPELQDAAERAVHSRRQPGSAFKPFVYSVALEGGMSPVSTISGLRQVSIAAPEGVWIPRDERASEQDTLSLREALLESSNAAAVLLQQHVGSKPVLRLASDLGVTNQPDVPSLALGSGLVTPLDLTAAYAVFPTLGYRVRPRGLIEVENADGDLVHRTNIESEQVLSPQVSFQMLTMLEDVIDRGTGAAARRLGVHGAVGGKTGTTNDYRDAWFVGFNSAVVVGVWVGYDQPGRIREGGTG